MSVLVSDILLFLLCGFRLRFLKARGIQGRSLEVTHPNSEACSGICGFPRGLRPDNDPVLCPKIKTEPLSTASSTRPATSEWVVTRLPESSTEETSSFG